MSVRKFETNLPQVVALKFAEGREVEGRFGNQVMYSLADGDTMYLHPAVAAKISALQLQPGEPIEIVKREKRVGNAKGIEWEVARVAKHPDVRKNSPTARDGAAFSGPAPSMPPVAAQLPESSSGQSNSTTTIVHTHASQAMTGCLIAAIDALVTAESYATSKGMKLEFNEEDVRCTALSLYIQASRVGFLPPTQNGGSAWQQ